MSFFNFKYEGIIYIKENKMEYKILKEISSLPNNKTKYFDELFQDNSTIYLEHCSLVTASKGKKIIATMEDINKIWILISGKVKALEELATGEIYIFQKFSAPEVFGEMETFAGINKFKASVIAETDCTFITIPVFDYIQFMKEHSNYLFKRTQAILKRTLNEGKNNRIYLMLKSIERIKMYFIEHYKINEKEKVCILNNTRQQISDETGYSIKTINRGIKKLIEEQYIKVIGQKIYITEKQYQDMVNDIDAKLYQS